MTRMAKRGSHLQKPELPVRTTVSCSIVEFCQTVVDYDLHSLEILKNSPFYPLILSLLPNEDKVKNKVKKKVKDKDKDKVKVKVEEIDKDFSIKVAENFDVDKRSLTVSDFTYTMSITDIKNILKIPNEGEIEDVRVNQVNEDLKKKFCLPSSQYKVSMDLVKMVLEKKTNEDDLKRAFALISLRYIVCPPTCGYLPTSMLHYVEDVSRMGMKPWADLAMRSLEEGIRGYKNWTKKQKARKRCIGGSMYFFERYLKEKVKNWNHKEAIFGQKKSTETQEGSCSGREGAGVEDDVKEERLRRKRRRGEVSSSHTSRPKKWGKTRKAVTLLIPTPTGNNSRRALPGVPEPPSKKLRRSERLHP